MVLIPTDTGLRMRLENELLPKPIAPVQEIATDLPRLQIGQVFTAQIRDVLPDKTYLALVAGKSVTLSLPESVKSGDILELVVVDQTPKTVIAQLANQPGTAADAAAYQHTTLSQTAQMLGTLLAAEGETPTAAPLNRGQPLLAQPPQRGADLVPVLSKAVTESGLFYEAHQAQWVAGKLPLRNLLQEPQGSHPAPASALPPSLATSSAPAPTLTSAQAAAPALIPAQVLTPSSAQTQTLTANPAPPLLIVANDDKAVTGAPPKEQTPPGPSLPPSPTPAPQLNKAIVESLLLYLTNQAQGAELQKQNPVQTSNAVPPGVETAGTASTHPNPISQPATSSPPATPTNALTGPHETAEAARLQTSLQTSQSPPAALSIPDDLRALVQQQLDAAGTQRLLWHGEVWPGQTMQWQLAWQDQGGGQSGAETAEPWSTTLRLTTPRLGELEASLQLGVAGVRIALTTTSAGSATDMRAGATDLENSLAAAGVPLLGFSVKHDQEEQQE